MSGSHKLSDQDFATIAQMMRDLTGIALKESKRAMVAARLASRVRALRLSGLPAYCDMLRTGQDVGEIEKMVSALTTNTTRFDRERRQIDHFETEVLPGLVQRARTGGRVRLWSAGCSTGEEPYSLAFRVLDQCPEAARLDFKILATDIDRQVVRTAQIGQYPESGLATLSEAHAETYFDPPSGTGGERRVGSAARQLITFRVSNLLEPWPFRGPFDMVMCRNVFIYFDTDTQNRIWPRLAEILAPGGMLYIGHSESIGDVEGIGLTTIEHSTFQKQTAQDRFAPARAVNS